MDALRGLSAPQIAGLACMMEVACPKPGNVSPGRPFRYINDMSFLASAMGLVAAFGDGSGPVGLMIEDAALATKNWVDRNTNLGMILLLAPLVKASCAGVLDKTAVRATLESLDGDDARRVYSAIRVAAPEGLGRSEKFDVQDEAPPLLEAMKLASQWDSVAGEYASGYAITFGRTAPRLAAFWRDGYSLKDCILQTYLALLAEVPDTLIARKLGREASEEVATEAWAIVEQGGCFTAEGRERIAAFDASLFHPDNLLNPGTTADLTAAGIFVFLSDELGRNGLPDILARWEDDDRGGA